MDYSGYLPRGDPLIFQVECGTKVSPPMSVTICNTLPLSSLDQTFTSDGTIGISSIFSGATGSCGLSGCNFKLYNTGSSAWAEYSTYTGKTGAAFSTLTGLGVTYSGYEPTGVAQKFKTECDNGITSPEMTITVCNI